VQINAADESFRLSVLKEENIYPDEAVAAYRRLIWGASLKIKSVDGVTTLIKGGQFSPAISGTVLVGGTPGLTDPEGKKRKGIMPVLYAILNVDHSKFNLVKANNPYAFDRKSLTTFSATGGINWEGKFTRGSDFVFGGQVKFGKYNNQNDLDNIDIYTSPSNTQGGTTSTRLSGQKSGFEGAYEEGYCLRANIDLYIYPNRLRNNPMGFGGYIRSEIAGFAPRQNAGVGVVLGQKGAPSAVAFGIMYQFNDLFDQQGAGTSAFSRGGLNLIAGFNFGSGQKKE
jgi:hypothetical protein